MKQFSKIAAAACLMFAFSGSAFASDPYVGASVGAFNIGTGVSKKAAVGTFLQVGDDFSQYLGGELRIGTSANAKLGGAGQAKARIDYFGAALLKPKYDINEQLMAYGLIGVATLRASYTENGLARQKKTRTGYAYGAGLQYRVADHYALDAEYMHMLSKPKTSATAIRTGFAGAESSVFTVGFKYFLY